MRDRTMHDEPCTARAPDAPIAPDAPGTWDGYYSPMRLKVTRLNPSVPLPVYSHARRRRRSIWRPPRTSTSRRDRSGWSGPASSIAVPDGHFLAIFARSSTPLKRGLVVANGVGVIDSDYCGPADEVKIQVLNSPTRR